MPDLPDASSLHFRGPINRILYGPPGTGKTHQTAEEVVRLLRPEVLTQGFTRAEVQEAFEGLQQEGRVEFVTFHQSFAYEDFVEGIRAETTEQGDLQYVVRDGVFKQLVQKARALLEQPSNLHAEPAPVVAPPPAESSTESSAEVQAFAHQHGIDLQQPIWKISIKDEPTRDYCLDHGEVRVPFGHVGDVQHPENHPGQQEALEELKIRQHVVRNLANIPVGSLIALSPGKATLEALGVVTGPYWFDKNPPGLVHREHQHVLPVRWLFQDQNIDFQDLTGGRFNPSALHSYLTQKVGAFNVLARFLGAPVAHVEVPEPLPAAVQPPACCLVIDEINRGNVSRIFGELITLLEPSRRTGMQGALAVRLPYSREVFSVPANLHVIGTMNTADRSLTSLDLALRRRFEFREMPPRPELLSRDVAGVNVQRLLFSLNRRIEMLFDRDHQIGHAYFLALRPHSTLEGLAGVMEHSILPLLQEYFFEDWSKIRMVLADDQTSVPDEQFVLESEEDGHLWLPRARTLPVYRVNPAALLNRNAYLKIYQGLPDTLFAGL